jgi:peptidoglycan/xylan/chitin deacetylase (PgdA/CDA1 family)
MLRIRHDDFDFRMDTQDYINIHEEFIKHGLVETAVLQFTTDGNLKDFKPELITYMNERPNWDFQIHGWAHEEYDKMTYDQIVKDLASCIHFTRKLFYRTPTIWFTPWNRRNETMEKAAAYMGLEISNESYDIARFIREVKEGIYTGSTLYFHGWNHNEMEYFQEMLDLAKEFNESR